MFLARNTNLLTLSGLRDERKQVTMFPLVLKTLSEEELVAGMQRYFLASFESRGYILWDSIHHFSGSSSASSISLWR